MDGEELKGRLIRRFGLGARQDLRLALYERLARLAEDEEVGQEVVHVVATVCADSVGKTNPPNYFAFVVMRRLIDRKLVPAPEI